MWKEKRVIKVTKSFKVYLLIWTMCLIIFNIVIFASPARINVVNGNFWIGYIFIIIAFLIQLACTYIALKKENLKRMFYNISLILISYIYLFLLIVVGTICIVLPAPISITIILCIILTGLFTFIIIVTCFSISFVSNIDREIKSKTFTIKQLTVDAEHLINVAKTDELKIVCKKVYEALRYSDPMNNMSLSEINQLIQNEFKTFENDINENDIEIAQAISIELINLIDKRNKKCTLLK